MDALTRTWLGLSARHAAAVVAGGLLAGGAIEAFMINVWIKETNFYGVVLKKEREKREAAAASGERPFAEILKEQWEEKKRELAAAEARK